MNEPNLPSYARLPNGPHEPNITPHGVMVVDDPRKMAKTLMKLATHLHKPKAQSRNIHGHAKHKKDQTKWY